MKKTKMRTITYCIFIALFLVISLLPLVLFNSKQASIGNETKVAAPKLSDGLKMTSNFDSYFARYFGGRNKLVSLGNTLKQDIFSTSGQDSVIVGEDGWLFYGSALGDYTGTSDLSDAQLERAAVVISMMQNYVESQNDGFLFVIAPNKMSIYGDYMPYYYQKRSGWGNYEKLYDDLLCKSVNTISLKQELHVAKSDEVLLYHKLDSHWNNMGASVAYEAMAYFLNNKYGEAYKNYSTYGDRDYAVVANFKGDLNSMLAPYNGKLDEQIYFTGGSDYDYEGTFTGVDDMLITTVNSAPAVDKKVTLFRDSFGNALYSFFANDYATLSARRNSVYNMITATEESDLVVIELVERNIKNLLVYSPVLISSNTRVAYELTESKCDVNMQARSVDGLYYITGQVECEGLEFTQFYLDTANYTYQLIPALDNGIFSLYIEENGILSELKDARIITVENGHIVALPANVTLQE